MTKHIYVFIWAKSLKQIAGWNGKCICEFGGYHPLPSTEVLAIYAASNYVWELSCCLTSLPSRTSVPLLSSREGRKGKEGRKICVAGTYSTLDTLCIILSAPYWNAARQTALTDFLLMRQFCAWEVKEFALYLRLVGEGPDSEAGWVPVSQSSGAQEDISTEPWGPPDRVHDPAVVSATFLVTQLFYFLACYDIQVSQLSSF